MGYIDLKMSERNQKMKFRLFPGLLIGLIFSHESLEVRNRHICSYGMLVNKEIAQKTPPILKSLRARPPFDEVRVICPTQVFLHGYRTQIEVSIPWASLQTIGQTKAKALDTTEGQELKISPRSAFHLHNLDFRSLPIFPKIALEFKHLFSYPKRLDSQQKHRYIHIFISYS